MKNKIYFDNAATTPLCKSFSDHIQEYASKYYNPSSINENSLELRKEIEKCREKIAMIINCDSEEIYFTSGASEANALAVDGFLKVNSGYKVISTNIEHDSIMNNPNISQFIPCDHYGLVKPVQFEGYNNTLFAVILANNEVGTIQPVEMISNVIHGDNNYLFCDATQAFGKINIDVKKMGIDMLSASAHKIGGLKNIGFLYVNKSIKISPIIYGNQEEHLRGGTYNYLGIKSLSCAIDEIINFNYLRIMNLRDYLAQKLVNLCPNITINGHMSMRLPNNLNICIHDIIADSQQLVSLLDLYGFIVSAGSACNSGENKPSHVLMAMYNDEEIANHSIRITLGNQNTKEEVDEFIRCLKNIIKMYKI